MKTAVSIFLLLLAACVSSANAFAQEVRIIAHPSVVAKELNASQLRSIFSMKQSAWPDGQPVKVFVLASNHVTHQLFCKRVLRMFPYQVERIWNKLTYSGLGDLPVQVQSELEMFRKISETPGSIGYVVDAREEAGIQTVRLITE